MGRSITPTFRIEFREVTAAGRPVHWTSAGWDTKHAGRPSAETLAAHVRGMEASTEPGGVNEHLGATTIGYARIVRQSTDEVMAEYRA